MKACNRKFLRVNYPCSITVWRQDGASDVVMANTANISAGGICVYLNEALIVGVLLEIKIDNFFEGRALKCQGRVVRCQPDKTHKSGHQKYFEIGIEFLEMETDQCVYLAGFVERLKALEIKK